MTVVTGGMDDGGNHDGFLRRQNFVNHAAGKTFRVTPADVLARMPPALLQGVFHQNVKHPDNLSVVCIVA